ncbi:hypothetical protein [Phaeobacter inhibens]|nr:hypothetical protein [Phaeobacter inhibens]
MGREKDQWNYPRDFKRQMVAQTMVEGATVARDADGNPDLRI